jgi:transcriptional regulator with XRE-family HTH domain
VPKLCTEDFVSEDWLAVGDAVSSRMRERGITQKQLAERSKVSPATIRQIQHHNGSRKHGPRTLEALSDALGWPSQYLDNVLNGRGQQETADEMALLSRLSALEQQLSKISAILEQRLGDVVDVIYHSDSDVDITIEIKHGPRE